MTAVRDLAYFAADELYERYILDPRGGVRRCLVEAVVVAFDETGDLGHALVQLVHGPADADGRVRRGE